jgi:hypothetical protein
MRTGNPFAGVQLRSARQAPVMELMTGEGFTIVKDTVLLRLSRHWSYVTTWSTREPGEGVKSLEPLGNAKPPALCVTCTVSVVLFTTIGVMAGVLGV